VKRSDLERELKKAGWWFERHGGSHDIWTNGADQTQVPRHREINEYTAKSILRLVRGVSR
jgi:mRNA interferase HicA